MDDSLKEFREWASIIKRQPGDPDLREAQTKLLDRALQSIADAVPDQEAAFELEAWAAMQEARGTYPAMAAAFRHAASILRA